MTIRCLTFDLDETLWAIHPVIHQAEKKFYQWLIDNYPNITQDFPEIAVLTQHRKTFYLQCPDLHYHLTRLRKHWLSSLQQKYQLDNAFIDTAFNIFWTARNQVTLYPNTESTLANLAQSFQLGSISNGNACLHRVGLAQYFIFSVNAEQIGVKKPDPAIFAAAIKKAKVLPNEILHIGDDPLRDVIGAKNAGLKTVWYNPHIIPWPGGQTPDFVITKISSLIDILKPVNIV